MNIKIITMHSMASANTLPSLICRPMYPHSICIFGGGYLGTRLLEYFGSRAFLLPTDITDLQAVRLALAEHKPLIVINTAAKTHTNDLENPENQDLAYRVNVQGVANCALAAKEHEAFLVHISTGMIFTTSEQSVTEEALPDPKSYYAQTKAWADVQLQPFAERDGVLIARIQLPLSKIAHQRNILTKLIGFSTAVDEKSSFTVLEDCLPALEQLIAQRNSGIFNVVNPGSISFYAISQLLSKYGLIAPGKMIEKYTDAQMQAITADRGGAYQPYVVLDTHKLLAVGVSIVPINEAVERSIRNYTV